MTICQVSVWCEIDRKDERKKIVVRCLRHYEGYGLLKAREGNSEHYSGLGYDSGNLFRRFRLVRWITPAHEILIRTRDSNGFMDYTTQQNQELRQNVQDNFGTNVHNNMRVHLGMGINIRIKISGPSRPQHSILVVLHNSKVWESCQTAGPIATKFGTSMHIQ